MAFVPLPRRPDLISIPPCAAFALSRRYPVQLFYGKVPCKELSYPSHLMSVNKAFKTCEIKCSKKTHAPALAQAAAETQAPGHEVVS